MSATTRRSQAIAIVVKLGTARAKDGTHVHTGGHENKVGAAGVDFTGGKYRARIRFCDALNGNDTRLTLGRYDNVADAGFAYRAAHVALWGALSPFVAEMTVEDIAALEAAGIATPGRTSKDGLGQITG